MKDHSESKPNVDNLHVAQPCPKRWEALEGQGRERLCSDCERQVYDSRAWTRGEIEALATQTEGRLCMRVERDAKGRPRFKDSARLAGWTLAVGSGLLASCGQEAPVRDAPAAESPADSDSPGAEPADAEAHGEPTQELTEEELRVLCALGYVSFE